LESSATLGFSLREIMRAYAAPITANVTRSSAVASTVAPTSRQHARARVAGGHERIRLALGHEPRRHRHGRVQLARQRLAGLLVHGDELGGVLHRDALAVVSRLRERVIDEGSVPHQQRVDVR
jgi:hypothetical protein